MYIANTATCYGTFRIYIRARDSELKGKFDNFQTIKKFMDLTSCWGGADKQDRDYDDNGGFVSWEVRQEDAYAVYSALQVMLLRASFHVIEDLHKATERFVEQEAG
jgi:hypothetical protein